MEYRKLLCSWILFLISVFNFINGIPTGYQTKLTQVKTLPFQDCGSIYDMLYLKISSCDRVPCRIPVGKSIQLTAEFYVENAHTINVLKHDVQWIINNAPTKATISPESCDDRQKCPSKGLQGLKFAATIFVNKTLPTLRGQLSWKIRNEYGRQVICYKIPITLI